MSSFDVKKSRLGRLVACVAVVILLAAGCGGGGGSSDDGGGGGGEPSADQTLRVGMGFVSSNLDPISTTAITDYTYLRLIYDTLVSVDSGSPEPWAAESFEALDPQHWRFVLKEGITFSNGEPLDAEAVRYTFQRALDDPATPWRVRIASVERMEVVDDLTIDFFLSSPVGNFPTRTSVVWLVPPVYGATPDALVTEPIGTGPFTVSDFSPGEKLTLSGNPDYWGNPPELETVEFTAIPEESTRASALSAGDIDVAHRILPDFVDQIESAGAAVVSVPSALSANIFFQSSVADSPLADVRVRQAIDYAIDKEALTDAVTQGYGGPLHGQIVGEDSVGFNDDLEQRPYDPDMARELLEEAGYGDGLEIAFDYPLGRYFRDKETAEAVSAYLGEVGITVTQNPMEGGAWLDRLYTGSWGPLNYWSIQDAPAYDVSWTLEIFLSNNIRKITNDPEFDAMLAESFTITDQDERDEFLQEVSAYVFEQTFFVTFHHDPGIYAVSPNVEGIEFLPSTYINLFDTQMVD
ncbi:MAG: ABC transporter substrate-binding protein [Actinomycetota bacterium]|nr:ABC transporter substrate-binding protein [Actinomycetota bacterium]